MSDTANRSAAKPGSQSHRVAGDGRLRSRRKGGGDLRSAVQNPISSLISLPFKFSFDYGADNGEASFLNIQPVVPVTVGDWNLVNRVIMPLIDTPGQVTPPRFAQSDPGQWGYGLGGYQLLTAALCRISCVTRHLAVKSGCTGICASYIAYRTAHLLSPES